MRLPTISPVAMVEPVDSTAVISSTMIIVRQATKSNLGMPNRNGWVKPIASACADLVEVHVAQREGDRAADDQAEQHRDGGQEAAEQPLDPDDDRDGAQRVEEPADVGRVVLVGVRVGDGVTGADGHQTQSDDGDQGAGHHGWEEPQQLDEDRRDQEREDARDDHRAVDVEQAGGPAAVGQADRDDRGDARERHALQQRQSDADLPEPDGLDDRGDTAGEQVRGDELDQVFLRQVDRAGDDDRHQHRARVERHDVLEAVEWRVWGPAAPRRRGARAA